MKACLILMLVGLFCGCASSNSSIDNRGGTISGSVTSAPASVNIFWP